jgi:5'(3')-deoxyribonucleotidase
MVPRKLIHFDLDGVLANWDARRGMGYDPDGRGFYQALEPFAEGVRMYHRLCQHHEVLIASTAPWENPWAWTEKRHWVAKHLGDGVEKCLTLTHRKDLLIGDYLIDDRTKNGAGSFTGKLILFGSEEFPDWGSVEEHFIDRGLLLPERKK